MPNVNDNPNNPDPVSPPLSGRSGLLANLADLARASFQNRSLPALIVSRSGAFLAAGAAAVAEATFTPSAVVESLQKLVKGVLLSAEGYRAPELLREVCSAVFLRLEIKERSKDEKLDAVGNAPMLEGAALALLQAYNEDPRARAVLPASTMDLLKDLAELQLRDEVLKALRGPCEVMEGAVHETQHRVSSFIRTNLPLALAVAERSPLLLAVLAPAQAFVSGPALRGQETRKVTEKAHEEGRAIGRAEGAAEAKAEALKTTAHASGPTVNLNPVVASPPAAPVDPDPATPSRRSRTRMG